MNSLARAAVSTFVLLIATTTAASHVLADGDCDLWDLVGTQVYEDTGRSGGDDLWDLLGTDVVGDTNTVEFDDVGIVLSVTPRVEEGKHEVDLVFILVDDATFLNVGTDHKPRWERISEKEFWLLVDGLEDRGFGFVADIVEEEYLLGVVLFTT